MSPELPGRPVRRLSHHQHRKHINSLSDSRSVFFSLLECGSPCPSLIRFTGLSKISSPRKGPTLNNAEA